MIRGETIQDRHFADRVLCVSVMKRLCHVVYVLKTGLIRKFKTKFTFLTNAVVKRSQPFFYLQT